MRLAVTATGPRLDDRIEERFGRCAYFIIIDSTNWDLEAIPNPNLNMGGGMGIQSAQLLSQKGIQVVLTGNCGQNATQVFGSSNIQVITGVSGTVRQAVEAYLNGHIASTNIQSVAPPQPGMGGGMGQGMRGGMGRGMGCAGRGMGRGMGQGMGRGMGCRGSGGPGMNFNQTGPRFPGNAWSNQFQMEQPTIPNQGWGQWNLRGQPRAGSPLVAVVDTSKCIACGLCQEACPTGAITVNDVAVVKTELCDGCGQCVSVCPQDALSLRKA